MEGGQRERQRAMNDIEKFFYDSMAEFGGPLALEPGFFGMGEVSRSSIGHVVGMHPTREDEVVYVPYDVVSGNTHQFTPSFVKECFEASKGGKNALLDYLYDIHPIL
jgi:hypothetical protein